MVLKSDDALVMSGGEIVSNVAVWLGTMISARATPTMTSTPGSPRTRSSARAAIRRRWLPPAARTRRPSCGTPRVAGSGARSGIISVMPTTGAPVTSPDAVGKDVRLVVFPVRRPEPGTQAMPAIGRQPGNQEAQAAGELAHRHRAEPVPPQETVYSGRSASTLGLDHEVARQAARLPVWEHEDEVAVDGDAASPVWQHQGGALVPRRHAVMQPIRVGRYLWEGPQPRPLGIR